MLQRPVLLNIRHTFKKHEKLKSRKEINRLFDEGRSSSYYPVKLLWLPSLEDHKGPAQALFVVPKKNFRKAHERNVLKRRMRECYRLYKHTFYEKLRARGLSLSVAFVYTGRNKEDFQVIQAACELLISKI